MIQVNPVEGFGPHLVRAFLDLYGENSVFVAATVDCLNYRFVRVMIRAELLPADFSPPQYGTPEMRQALETLLKALDAHGLENPPASLMQSAVGYAEPQAFQSTAAGLLGDEVVGRWLQRLEQEDYSGATALLEAH